MLLLAPREKKLAQLLKSDACFSMKQIAGLMDTTVNTVKFEAQRLYRAFGVTDRVQFALFFALPLNHPRMVEWLS